MAEGKIQVQITSKLYYFLDGKKIRNPETGKAVESFDAVIKRLCGYNAETG